MVVGGSQQETLDPGFVLLVTGQETHLTKAELKRLDLGEVLSYSIHEIENALRTLWVTFMLSKVARTAIIG
ncbi:unnamed protein product [Schistosoma margrebowiei]|uniref:Uncharacterized protein n=1 Tax=Schistosoma margrebowiei TaxID=48269 RepID=A0A183LH67_9TREM|nr:unnamed protein product [Schistosoma margrebowiei]